MVGDGKFDNEHVQNDSIIILSPPIGDKGKIKIKVDDKANNVNANELSSFDSTRYHALGNAFNKLCNVFSNPLI